MRIFFEKHKSRTSGGEGGVPPLPLPWVCPSYYTKNNLGRGKKKLTKGNLEGVGRG